MCWEKTTAGEVAKNADLTAASGEALCRRNCSGSRADRPVDENFLRKRLRKRFDGHIVALSLLIDFEGNSQHFDRKRLWPQRRRFWERDPRYWRSDHRGAVIGKNVRPF
jgi:hypothetical protein